MNRNMLKGHRILTNDRLEVNFSFTAEIKDFLQQHKKIDNHFYLVPYFELPCS